MKWSHTKVTVSSRQKRKSFWDFWTESPIKITVAILLALLAGAILAYYPLIGTETVVETITIEGTTKSENTTSTSTKPVQIPQSNIIAAAIIIAIILFPEIKSAKFGDIEIELQQVEEFSVDPLTFADEPFRMVVEMQVASTPMFVPPFR